MHAWLTLKGKRMSMRCLAAFMILLGLGTSRLAMAIDGPPPVDSRDSTMSRKITARVCRAVDVAKSHHAPAQTHHAMRFLDGEWIDVFIDHDCAAEDLAAVVQQRGQILNDNRAGTTYAKLYYGLLEQVAAMSCVRQIKTPVFGHLRTGSVTSTADAVMRANALRTNLGVDGNEIRVGIISDSLVNLQASVDSGDLPPDVEIVNGRDGRDVSGFIDEGRAMAELIHDLAPGATLLFHSGIPTSLDMIDAIEALTAAGAHIIVDDLGFFGEPYFEDGPVAQAVQAAIDAGVLYVTAVGNDAEANYSGMYREFDPDDGDTERNFHDFGGGDTTMGITIPPGGSLQAILQWPNRFDGSENTADYDLLVFNAAGTATACASEGISGVCNSNNAQLAAQLSPTESVVVRNDTAQFVPVNLMINRFSGEALPLRIVFGGAFSINEHNVPDRSAFGHPCVREAMSVGAINVNDPGFDTIESFSSRGPCEIFFTTANVGTQVAGVEADGFRTSQVVALTPPEIRHKPDVVAADATNTSLAFFSPFFGTSAAAPHAAAVAALLMELGGGPNAVSAAQILDTMRVAAVDQGTLGVDGTFGFGVVDAVLAGEVMQSATNTPPIGTIDAPADDVIVTSGATVSFQGRCVDAENDEPFAFAWDFGGGADVASSTAQNPNAIFRTPGVFTVTMTCRDALGATSLPVTVRVLVNPADQGDDANDGDDGGTMAVGSGGGGGGCALVIDASRHPLSALGNIFLPLLTIGIMWL